MRRRYFTLDVFTTRKFAGNPLAVVLESDGLDTASQQSIAREFNLPETVFVYPANDAKHRARVRIFTPARELPFAGHPTVGTAVLMAHLDGGSQQREVVLAEQVGPVVCQVTPRGGGGEATFAIPKMPERMGPVRDGAKLAAALGLAGSDLANDIAPESWTAGNAFTFVPVRGLDAMRRARPNMTVWDEAIGLNDPPGVFLFCREVEDRAHAFHARMFAPAMGVAEDPATGSAVAAFAGLLAASGGYADGQHNVGIEQGYEMGRPSVLWLGLSMQGGRLRSATVGGDAVIVSEGMLDA